MSNNLHSPSPARSRRPSSSHVSPFFRDLASPIISSSASRHNHRLPSLQSLTPSAPPPPLFSLDDMSPDRDLASPSSRSPPAGPSFSRSASLLSPIPPLSSSSFRARLEESSPIPPLSSSSFRARLEEASGSDGLEKTKWKGKGLMREDQVVESGALILHPTVDEESRNQLKRNEVINESLNEEEWVTVFGFYPSNTNLVLREFERCGVILRHITGPRDANWMHILYQNRYDAKRALEINGTQINNSLVIGVKLVNAMEKKILNEKINNDDNYNKSKSNQNGFMVSSLPAGRGRSNTVTVSGPHRTGNVAVPAKSVVSKALDLVFGM